MPSMSEDYYGLYSPTKRELECRAIVRAHMLASGWHPQALKFRDVCNRRAKTMSRGQ